MQETIERLRQQPKEHRTAIAASIAIGVVALLMIGWFLFFMHNLSKGSLEYTRPPDAVEPTSAMSDEPSEEQMSPAAPFDASTSVSVSTSAATTSAPVGGLNKL